jgi:diguanylate cyclase (GGDEF)-like protein
MGELIQKIKKTFLKCSLSDYVKNYLFESNVRSSIIVGIIVCLLESWMIIGLFRKTVAQDLVVDSAWNLKHGVSYVVLLVTAFCMLVYSTLYLKGKIHRKWIGTLIKIVFSAVSLGFGLYVSYMSYDWGGRVFLFLTMEVFVTSLFVWHPFVSFCILSVTFELFLYLCNIHTPLTYSIRFNSFTAWLVLLMSSVNIHNQRRIEAQKAETLENLNEYLREKSLLDELTGLYNMRNFRHEAEDILQDESVDLKNLRFVFLDLENFKNYNEKYGFSEGNSLLRTIAQIIKDCFPDNLVARYGDDHFVALADADGLEEKIKKIQEKIVEQENSIQLGLKCGIYTPKDRDESPSLDCDHARYACSTIKKHFNKLIVEYDESMDKDFKIKRYVINNINKAIEKGYIMPYYQPVVWAKNGKVCGAEALARWIDPEYGFMSPAAFVPTLEEYHLIHKLDMYIMECVCRDLKQAREENHPLIPVSINFSRLDFELTDPVSELNECIEKYGISKDQIHVEITESALAGSGKKIQDAMEQFRKQGYALWLDDFGSGYSGLNVLKDYNFDMMKIDMKFLSKFSENQKTQPILTSIIALAQKIGMQTLTEGVETEDAYRFLQEVGCQRLQGYLFGKPMIRKEFYDKITTGEYEVATD